MMKKIFLLFFGLAAMLTFAACSNEEPGNVVTTNPTSGVKGTLTKMVRPTNWEIVQGTTYACMCIFLDEDGIPATVDEQDLMAAFINGECRGKAAPVFDAAENYWRFNLSVNSTTDDEQASSLAVELRYYSAKNGGTYTAKTIPYAEGAPLGEYGKGNGFVPEWK